MEYIDIKGIAQPISRIVLGTAWFNLNDRNTIFDLIDYYISQGGNVIDCGRYYGAGQSELILKEYLISRNNRNGLIIVNKCCHPIIENDGKHHSYYWRVKPDLITEDLHNSLIRTGLDYFDIYLMHRDDEKMPVSILMDRLEQHCNERLIKAYGVSNWSLKRVQEAYLYCKSRGYNGFSINNPSYSLATVLKPRWESCIYADDDYAHWHKETDLTLISWAAQAHGFFADIYPNDETTPQDIKDAFFNKSNFEKLERCKILAIKYDIDPINIALAYILSQDINLAVVIGGRNIQELQSSMLSLNLKLTPLELQYLSLKRQQLDETF